MDCISRRQAKESGLKKYYTGKPCKKGHVCERFVSVGICVECNTLNARARRLTHPDQIKLSQAKYREDKRDVLATRARERRANNLEQERVKRAAYDASNRERIRAKQAEYRARNRERCLAYSRAQYASNLVKRRQQARDYQKLHPQAIQANNAARRARRSNAQPPWVELLTIRQIYTDCPNGYHIDHTIPLKHKLVCGLHVPANLEAIPAARNLAKHNYFDPSEWSYDPIASTFVRTISPDASDFGYYDESKKDHEEWKSAA